MVLSSNRFGLYTTIPSPCPAFVHHNFFAGEHALLTVICLSNGLDPARDGIGFIAVHWRQP